MEAKHTPGPWFALSGGNVTRNTGPHWAAAGIYIAQVDQKSMSCEANARLIAAAPELAEALLCVIACLSQPVQTTEIGDDMRRLRGAVNILRVDAAGARKSAEAALRKAGILED